MNYEQFKKERDAKIYNSSAAEWNRMAFGRGKINLPNQDQEEVFEYIVTKFLNQLNTDETVENLSNQVGVNIANSKSNPIFLSAFKRGRVVEFQFKKGLQYHTLTIKVEKKNLNVVIKIKRSVKIEKTRTGMNGKLGTLKYRYAVRKEVRELELFLKNHYKLK